MTRKNGLFLFVILVFSGHSSCGGNSSADLATPGVDAVDVANDPGSPAPGTERGPCYGNHSCNAGLVCLSDICVQPQADGFESMDVPVTPPDPGEATDGVMTDADTTPDGALPDASETDPITPGNDVVIDLPDTSDTGPGDTGPQDEGSCIIASLGQGNAGYVEVMCSSPYRVSDLASQTAVTGASGQSIRVPTNSLIASLGPDGRIQAFVHAAGQRTVPLNPLASAAEMNLHVAALSAERQATTGSTRTTGALIGVSLSETLSPGGLTAQYEFTNPKLRAAVFFRGSSTIASPHVTVLAPRELGLGLLGGTIGGFLTGSDQVTASATDDDVALADLCTGGSMTGWAGMVGPLLVAQQCPAVVAAQSRLADAWTFGTANPATRAQFFAAQLADTYFLVVRLGFEIAQLASDAEISGAASCLLAMMRSEVFKAVSEEIVPGLVTAYLNNQVPDLSALSRMIADRISGVFQNPVQSLQNILGTLIADGITDPACLQLVCEGAAVGIVDAPEAVACAAIMKVVDALEHGAALVVDVADLCVLGTADLLDNDYAKTVSLPLAGPSACAILDCDCEAGSGPCCGSDCHFLGSDRTCDTGTSFAYGCSGSGCGNIVTITYEDRYCSGSSAACSGPTKPRQAVDLKTCDADSVCNAGNGGSDLCVPSEACAPCPGSPACSGHGTCTNGQCKCVTGFTGTDCSSACASTFCSANNHESGTFCKDASSTATCSLQGTCIEETDEACPCGCSGNACACCPSCPACTTTAVPDGCGHTCPVTCSATCTGDTCTGCGNGKCDSGETPCTCPKDCGDCAGCCSGSTCKAGTSDSYCGKSGASCKACPATEACSSQACVARCSASASAGASQWQDYPSGCDDWLLTLTISLASGSLHCRHIDSTLQSIEMGAGYSATDVTVQTGTHQYNGNGSCCLGSGDTIEAVFACECSGTAYINSHTQEIGKGTHDPAMLVFYKKASHSCP